MKYRTKTAIYHFNPSIQKWHVSIRGMPELGEWFVESNEEMERTVKEKLDAILPPEIIPAAIPIVKKTQKVISKNGNHYYVPIDPSGARKRQKYYQKTHRYQTYINRDLAIIVAKHAKSLGIAITSFLDKLIKEYDDKNPLS